MGIMDSWKQWSQNQWDKWGKKLQPTADQIQEWEIPEGIKPLIAKVSDILIATASMKWMKSFVEDTCSKYDDDFAKKLIAAVVNVFKKEG